MRSYDFCKAVPYIIDNETSRVINEFYSNELSDAPFISVAPNRKHSLFYTAVSKTFGVVLTRLPGTGRTTVSDEVFCLRARRPLCLSVLVFLSTACDKEIARNICVCPFERYRTFSRARVDTCLISGRGFFATFLPPVPRGATARDSSERDAFAVIECFEPTHRGLWKENKVTVYVTRRHLTRNFLSSMRREPTI